MASRVIRKYKEVVDSVEEVVEDLEDELEWVNNRISILEGDVDEAINVVETMPDRMLYTKDEIGQIEELSNLITHRTRLTVVITDLRMALAHRGVS